MAPPNRSIIGLTSLAAFFAATLWFAFTSQFQLLHFDLALTAIDLLHAQLTLALIWMVLGPGKAAARLVGGGIWCALLWLAVTRINAQTYLVVQPATALLLGGCGILAFAVPSGLILLIFRVRMQRRLVMVAGDKARAAPGRVRFGVRHLLAATAGFAVLSLALRTVLTRLAGTAQAASMAFDQDQLWISIFLGFFPGVLAAPFALLVLQPSLRTLVGLLVLPAVCLVEPVVMGSILAPAGGAAPIQLLDAAVNTALEHSFFVAVTMAACAVVRAAGLKLSHPEPHRGSACEPL